MASNRSRSNRSVGNKLNNLDSRVSRGEKGTNNPHLSPDVIEEAHLIDGSVAEAKIAERAVTEDKIARGAIGTEHLGIVNTVTADSGLTLKPGPDGGFIVIDGPEYVAPAAGSGDLYALAFNENNQVVVSTTGVGGGDGIAAMPAGSIQPWPGRTAPEGWLVCDGSAVSRTTYSALFNVLVPQIGTVTITNGDIMEFTTPAAHGLGIGDAVYITTTGTLPSGLTASTLYYVYSVPTSTRFWLGTTRTDSNTGWSVGGLIFGGSGGSGTHTLWYAPYGNGDGTTTFNVPDIRGRAVVGLAPAQTEFDTLGERGGSKTHILQPSEMPVHTHTGTTNSGEGSHRHWISGAAFDDGNMSTSGSSNSQDYGLAADAGGYTQYDRDSAYGRYSSYNGSVHQHNFTTASAGGSGGVTQAHNNLQPYIALNYIIKHMVADGMQGPQGIQGEPGDAATVAVGATTTGSPGSVATVANAGTSSAAVLNFTIPRGDTGAQGVPGAQGPSGTVTVGSTSTGVEGTDAQVTNSGTSTNAILEFVIPRGNSATIAVGTTTTGDPGTPASVTNVGDNHAAIFDFVVPEGIGATVDVGTVTTGTEDDTVTVTNTGTNVDAIFNFDIPQGKTGDSAGVQYAFSTTTTDADPGNGIIRANNSTPASITYLYFDNVDADGSSRTAWYDQWDNSNSVVKGQIYVGTYRSNAVAIFNITGAVEVATGYYKIPVSYVSGNLPADTNVCYVAMASAGNIGNETPPGGLDGQILSKASNADYDFEWVNNTPYLSSLLDVTLTAPITGGQALTYDDITDKWVNATPATTLDSLTDVELTAPLLDGQALTYELATDSWINATPASTLDSLTDVDISTVAPVDGDILTYDAVASEWIAQSLGNAAMPAGSVMAWGGATAPSGWLMCEGQAVSRTEYASLFSAIGTSFGAGDTVMTFNLPDLRGRVAVGRDSGQTEFDTLGETGGSKTTSFPTQGDGTSTGNGLAYSSSMSSVDDGTYNNLPPYQTLNYIIKWASGETPTDESQLTDRVSDLETIVNTAYNQMPAGAIMAWASNTAPSNWLICDGSTVSRTLYASLYATIGDSYGAGDGVTTFNLPDLRGRVPVGKSPTDIAFDTLGEAGGRSTLPGDGLGTKTGLGLMYGSSMDQTTTSQSNMPPFQTVNYVIKATAGTTEADSALTNRVSTLENTVGSMFPAGTILASALAAAPSGWAMCDGAAVSRSTYASLFAAIGTQYGSGDGVTTFNLPNLEGRVPVGRNGGDGGDDEFANLGQIGGSKFIQGHGSGTATGYGLTYSESVLTATGLTTAQNLPPYTVVNYLIRLNTAAPDAESEFVARLGELETFVGNGGNESPAGSIMAWGALTAPTNWLLCDGSVVLKADWPSLYAAIGNQYATGGETELQFRLPNMKGRVAVGRDASQTEFDTLGEAGGAKTHTLTASEIPAHSHPNTLTNATVASSSHTHYEGDLRAAAGAVNGNPGWYGYEATTLASRGPTSVTAYTVYGNNYSSSSMGYNHHTRVYGTTAGPNGTTTVGITNADNTGGGAHNNLQPYIVLNYIIKATSGASTTDSILVERVGALELDVEAPVKLNLQTISQSYAIPSGYNGLSVGPITIADGVVVTVADGSAWSIV